jgi:hypothetical protein
MPTTKEFEDYIEALTPEQYDALLQERILRLNPEQQLIAQARESQRKTRQKLIDKLASPEADEDTHEMVFNALRDMDGDECEHNRSYAKHCLACGQMDHLMFPEVFDEDGFHREQQPETD